MAKKKPPAERLRDWHWSRGITQSELARELGIGKSHMSLILNGKHSPRAPLAAVIERVTKGEIRAVEWAGGR